MPRNKGTKPREAAGKRVRIRTFGDPARGVPPYDTERRELQGWPADTTRWEISDPPHPFDVQFWKIVE